MALAACVLGIQAEMANARSFLEAEKAVSARLREEITKMKEAFAKAGRADAAPPRPMAVRPQPMTVVPGPRGSAVGAAVPAR